jgi:hypothetical protein
MICTHYQILTSADEIKENEIDGAYGMYGRQERYIKGSGGET